MVNKPAEVYQNWKPPRGSHSLDVPGSKGLDIESILERAIASNDIMSASHDIYGEPRIVGATVTYVDPVTDKTRTETYGPDQITGSRETGYRLAPPVESLEDAYEGLLRKGVLEPEFNSIKPPRFDVKNPPIIRFLPKRERLRNEGLYPFKENRKIPQ